MTTRIVNPHKTHLTFSEIKMLGIMFSSEGEIVIDAELKPNSGDSRIFVILIETNDKVDYLVAKITSASLIQKEWDAYQQYIPKKLKGITEIRYPPVFLPKDNIGGLVYPLIGNNKYRVESLLDYCRNAELHNIIHDIFEDELFENLQFLWGRGELQSQYTFNKYYGHLLPYYLILEEATQTPESKMLYLDLNHPSDFDINHGDHVSVVNGRISSVYADENAIAIKPTDNELGGRILWKAKGNISSYQVDSEINYPLKGRVQKTRSEQLLEYAQLILQEPFDPTAQSIQLSSGLSIPNPLIYLDSILHKSISVRFACIHGDLHLENILVEHYEHIDFGRNHIAHLIDFDNSRRDHVLRDPLKLETDIMTRLFPDLLVQANLPPETVNIFYTQLHNANIDGSFEFPSRSLQKPFDMIMSLRKLTRYYLFNPADWTEYYYGLVIYLLGALKFKTLDKAPIAPVPKSVAFLGAATIISLLLEADNGLQRT